MSKTYEDQQKDYYKTLQPVFSPALGEYVYFNSDGIRHLLFKGRRPRNPSERRYRFSLLPYISDVITNAAHAVIDIKSQIPNAIIWALSREVVKPNGTGKPCMTKVIVMRKRATGKVYFLSVMCQRKCVR